MIKKVIKYTDYDGVEREEEFRFNLSRAELATMELSEPGGFHKLVKKMVDTNDVKQMMELFTKLIMMSYGEKSPDGKRFVKSEELSIAFTQTEAYSELVVELLSGEEAAIAFFNGIIPQVPVEIEKKDPPA